MPKQKDAKEIEHKSESEIYMYMYMLTGQQPTKSGRTQRLGLSVHHGCWQAVLKRGLTAPSVVKGK